LDGAAALPEKEGLAMPGGNPAFSERTFETFAENGTFAEARAESRMTVAGAAQKTGILLALLVAAGAFTYSQVISPGGAAWAGPLAIGGAIGAFIVALVTIFKPRTSHITAPVYAVLEGLFLGAVSAVYNAAYHGLVPQAVGLTLGVLGCMLLAYQSGVIRVTDKFRLGVIAATGGIALVYFVSLLLNLFGVHTPYLHGGGPIAIVFSLVVVGIAALNLALDFDLIERGAAARAPKFMEWYSAFGLMVTLVWLYLEILRLLANLNRRN
jgi:uncharacterized YccA/Bax inhibitor family protein